MAKPTTTFSPQGGIGATVFRRQKDGKTMAYMLPAFDKKQWRKRIDDIRSSETAQELGDAAKAGSDLHRPLRCQENRVMFSP